MKRTKFGGMKTKPAPYNPTPFLPFPTPVPTHKELEYQQALPIIERCRAIARKRKWK